MLITFNSMGYVYISKICFDFLKRIIPHTSWVFGNIRFHFENTGNKSESFGKSERSSDSIRKLVCNILDSVRNVSKMMRKIFGYHLPFLLPWSLFRKSLAYKFEKSFQKSSVMTLRTDTVKIKGRTHKSPACHFH